jgi:hypothetical protein
MAQSQRKRAQSHYATDRAWAEAVQHAIEFAMGEPVSPKLAKPRPQLLSISPRGTKIELELRFLAGKRYCCAEWGCFLPAFDKRWWTRLREGLQESTERIPPPLTLLVHGVVEEGAGLRVLKCIGLSMLSEAYSYRSEPLRERDAH